MALGACADPMAAPTYDADVTLSRGGATGAPVDNGERIYGLTDNNTLVVFSSAQPNRTLEQIDISGLASGERVTGIDFRPSDLNGNGMNEVGQLFALTSMDRLYLVDPVSGQATAPRMLSATVGAGAVGIGFNPTVDRLRVHSAAGRNLRINPDNGATIVDGTLMFAAGDMNGGTMPMVTATAYTNNDNDPATGTTLYALDAATGTLTTFLAANGGPNGGQLSTVGALGVNVGAGTGFDISARSGRAYATIDDSSSGKSTLYAVDLMTGRATRLGLLAQVPGALLSIAVQP
jgi:hypothetical protein